MTTLREAAEMAMEALEVATTPRSEDRQTVLKAQAALREALAQPEPEPVAWMDREGDLYKMPEIEGWAPPHTLLYTHPPQHQEANPVVWQFRMRPDWVLDKDFWEPWTNCTEEQAADYQRVPHLHDWKYEVRLLFTQPPERNPLTDEAMRECAQAMDAEPLTEGWPELIKFARAIERAHGIGEKE